MSLKELENISKHVKAWHPLLQSDSKKNVKSRPPNCNDMGITKVFPVCEIYDSATYTITEQKACNRHVWVQFVTFHVVYGFLGPIEKGVIQQRISP